MFAAEPRGPGAFLRDLVDEVRKQRHRLDIVGDREGPDPGLGGQLAVPAVVGQHDHVRPGQGGGLAEVGPVPGAGHADGPVVAVVGRLARLALNISLLSVERRRLKMTFRKI